MHRSLMKLLSLSLLGGVVAVVGCSSSSSSSSPSGCSLSRTCANGAGDMQVCYTQAGGSCASVYYKVGSQTFDCVSCDDQSYCSNAALVACGVPEASVPADATLPDGVAPTEDSGPAGDSSSADTGTSTADSGAAADSGTPADGGTQDAAHD